MLHNEFLATLPDTQGLLAMPVTMTSASRDARERAVDREVRFTQASLDRACREALEWATTHGIGALTSDRAVLERAGVPAIAIGDRYLGIPTLHTDANGGDIAQAIARSLADGRLPEALDLDAHAFAEGVPSAEEVVPFARGGATLLALLDGSTGVEQWEEALREGRLPAAIENDESADHGRDSQRPAPREQEGRDL